MAMKTTTLNIRIEPDVKEQAEAVFKQLGISSSIAVNMFFKQVIMQRGLPFELKTRYRRVPDIGDMSPEEITKMVDKSLASIKDGGGIPIEEVFDRLGKQLGFRL